MEHRDDRSETKGTGVTRYVVGFLVVAVLLVVLSAQNSDRVELRLFFWDLIAPLYAVAIVAALAGGALAVTGAAMWRHQRRRRNADRVELDRLRGETEVVER